MNDVNLNEIYLITSYPKIKVTNINKNSLYTDFRKVIHKKQFDIVTNDVYIEILDACNNILDKSSQNEIVLFTSFNNSLSVEAQTLLEKICDNINNSISIICNVDNINDNKVNIFNVSDFGSVVSDAYENLINNGIFISKPLIIKNVNIDLKNATLYGTNISKFNINIKEFNTFLINKEIKTIVFDNNEIELTKTISNDANILNTIEYIIYMINNDVINDKNVYIFIKNKLLNIININAYQETKNKAIILYNKIRKVFNKILTDEVNKMSCGNDNLKILINYGKNATTQNKKIIMNSKAFKNIDKLKEIKNNEDIKIKEFIDKHECIDNNSFNESCEFFNSSVTLSNWFEEMQNDNGMGLLLKINSKSLNGYFNHIRIDNITNTYFPVIDYISTINEYFKKNTNEIFGDLNSKNIISGAAIGDANSIIPFYINKHHWKIVSKYIEPLFGIMIAHNPFNHNNNKSILFTLFVDMTIKLFDNSKKDLNEKYIKTYIAYLRTCAEVCFENKFNHGIRKMVSQYLSDPLFRVSKEISPYDKICSQTMVTGYILNDIDLKTIIIYFIEESIRLTLKVNNYNEEYIEYYNNLPENDKKNEEIILIESITNKIQYDLSVYNIIL